MILKPSMINVDVGENRAILNEKDARDLGVRSLDRVKLIAPELSVTAIVGTSATMVKEGSVGLMCTHECYAQLSSLEKIEIVPTTRPDSVELIKKKMEGKVLTSPEVRTIVKDIVSHNLSDVELAAYIVSTQIRGMNLDEVTELTKSMVETGTTIELDKHPIFDFHSIGGVPGNKITMLVVPIVAAAGLQIPKTCSRAISSACGTADIFEVLASVSLSKQQIKDITQSVGGVIAWGGYVNLAPADDLIIRVEYPLSIDPYAQVIASVLAKKKAVGADYFLLDIPTGPNTKVPDFELARRYAHDFIEVGRRLGIKVECAITYGGQPIGTHIGPALEAKEALMALEGICQSTSVVEKGCSMAGLLLEMGGVADGNGKDMAREILTSGKALQKLREIIGAQGGKPDVKSSDVEPGKFHATVDSQTEGYVTAINNKDLVKIARAAGAPKDKGAGLILFRKRGHQVKRGEPMFEIYADVEIKLDAARKQAQRLMPITIEGMVLERIPARRTAVVDYTKTE